MRFILLKSDDFAMFHQDIDTFGLEFYYRHKETFRRMYNEQGKEFWIRFLLSFRSAQDFDIVRLFKGKIKRLSDFIDSFYINIHEEFIDGSFSRAKQLFEDIVTVAEDDGYLSILNSHSLAKNPFHRKDTKDIYRRFFGNPVDLASYCKVFVLLPMYRRLAGSLCVCLRRWLDASELTNPAERSYWVPPPTSTAPTDKVKESSQKEDLKPRDQKKHKVEKPHDPKKHKVDILKLTITKDNTTAPTACTCKDSGRRKRDKSSRDVDADLDFGADDIILTEDLVDRLSSLFQLSNSYLGMNVVLPDLDGLNARLPKKLEKGQTNLQTPCSCDDEGPPTKTETQAKLEDWSTVVGSTEQDMVQRLHDVTDSGDYDSFGIRVKRRSIDTGKSEIEFKISASKKKSGSKQTGDVHNGGTAEPKSKETEEPKAKTSSKSNVNKTTSAKTKSTVTESKAPKETGVEKELKPAVESDSSKKVKTTELSNAEKKTKAIAKSDAQLNLKATEESDARKTLECTEKSDSQHKVKASEESDSGNRAKATKKSDAKPESKAAEVSESKKKAKTNEASDSREKDNVSVESDSRKKVKAAEKSSADQKLKATKGDSSPGKEAEVVVDKSKDGTGNDNQEEEEEELSRPGSKNVRICMTCGLQEPAPKVFKKCKRCKDEGCLDPPYYCGRDCQVLDWTTRHRQEHEKNNAGDPATL